MAWLGSIQYKMSLLLPIHISHFISGLVILQLMNGFIFDTTLPNPNTKLFCQMSYWKCINLYQHPHPQRNHKLTTVPCDLFSQLGLSHETGAQQEWHRADRVYSAGILGNSKSSGSLVLTILAYLSDHCIGKYQHVNCH